MRQRERLWPVEVARVFHRSPDWLRVLEKRGVIPEAPRDFAGRRFYTVADVERIRKILEARAAKAGRAA